ncbi:SRPBCC family protein [Nocardioides cynanchi]|uniref:SRPBCC family protein n=1 Tax=Nocardioides cynanchi TaxID=2558918 RepID=UPI001246DE7A|nr:SRPBCC domain-containing protein [Nocardioides cynanchi]
MDEHSFTTTLSVAASPAETFAAINDVRGWWSRDVDGITDEVGAEFDYRGNQDGVNLHRALIRVTDLVPGERVVWHVVDNWMAFIDDQREWTDTRIVFEITPTAEGSEIRFSHLGLVPSYECHDVCVDAWTFFVQVSLRDLIGTGRGEPMERLASAQPTAS